MDNRSGTVVKILGYQAKGLAEEWCAYNLGPKWDCRWQLFVDTSRYYYSNTDMIYNFVFESEADAVWFALVHGEHLYQE